ncbi:MAG TPA: DUF4019 domain-containing protein [Candidatus Acidoferrales bacterium]|nr:DUF4019 domain-containing protein [Candidatus Acidoferrales bacterium]
MTQDIALSRGAVTHFHEELDQQKFDEIYKEAAPDFQKATTQDRFVAIASAVHRKLGVVKDATQTSVNVNFDLSGTRVFAVYSTKFDGGDAEERFTWKIAGAKAMLVGYDINSAALILK